MHKRNVVDSPLIWQVDCCFFLNKWPSQKAIEPKSQGGNGFYPPDAPPRAVDGTRMPSYTVSFATDDRTFSNAARVEEKMVTMDDFGPIMNSEIDELVRYVGRH